MPFLDRHRASRLMREQGIDALVLFQPENFTYATGAGSGVTSMWRRGGACIAIVPSDPNAALPVVVGDLDAKYLGPGSAGLDVRAHRIWIDMVDLTDVARDGRTPAEIVQDGYRRASDGASFRPRPGTFDFGEALRLLGDALAERGLRKARLGVDLEFLPAADYFTLAAIFPTLRL